MASPSRTTESWSWFCTICLQDSADGNSQPSVLYQILPAPVQKRVPRMASLRRSLRPRRTESKEEELTVATHSPPGDLDIGYVEATPASASAGRNASSRSSLCTTTDSDVPTPGVNGREWRYAKHGIDLLESVITEADFPEPQDQAFQRQEYVHAVAYLLHGLPRDLGQHEVAMLERDLPLALKHSLVTARQRSPTRTPASRSFPRRVLASGIVQFYLLFQLLLPYIQLFLKSAYEYNRTHRISERAIAASLSALDNMGHKGVELIGNLIRSSNGRGLQVFAALSLWWIREVSNGIQDGMEHCAEITNRGKRDGTMVEKGA